MLVKKNSVSRTQHRHAHQWALRPFPAGHKHLPAGLGAPPLPRAGSGPQCERDFTKPNGRKMVRVTFSGLCSSQMQTHREFSRTVMRRLLTIHRFWTASFKGHVFHVIVFLSFSALTEVLWKQAGGGTRVLTETRNSLCQHTLFERARA